MPGDPYGPAIDAIDRELAPLDEKRAKLLIARDALVALRGGETHAVVDETISTARATNTASSATKGTGGATARPTRAPSDRGALVLAALEVHGTQSPGALQAACELSPLQLRQVIAALGSQVRVTGTTASRRIALA